MNRLPFVLPDFTRVSWNSIELRKIWDPRFTKIKEAWDNVELNRESSLQTIMPELLPDLAIRANALDKIIIPLEKTGIGDYYSSTPAPIKNGRFQYKIVITNADKVSDWLKAWKIKDDGAIGHLLGFPSCCIDFFNRIWIDQKFVDTTWEMALKTWNPDLGVIKEPLVNTLQGSTTPENNILLRWLGLRLVSHLPCSFNCEDTKKIAEQNKETFRKLNYHDELEWLMELLSYPVEWSAKNGIAEIITPILRISSRTDATGDKYTVKLAGIRYESKIIDNWMDNGFKTEEDQRKAHEDLLTVASIVNGKVLDLGCGNGLLLSKIKGITPFGVDFSITKVKKAKELLPKGEFLASSIYDFQWITPAPFDYTFIAGNRLHENSLSGTLVRKLESLTKHVILYTYDSQEIESFYNRYFSNWKILRGSRNVLVLEP